MERLTAVGAMRHYDPLKRVKAPFLYEARWPRRVGLVPENDGGLKTNNSIMLDVRSWGLSHPDSMFSGMCK